MSVRDANQIAPPLADPDLDRLAGTWADPIEPQMFAGKHEGSLAQLAGITQFGVCHVTLEPGSMSALRHWHENEDEFVYVLAGQLTLIDDNGEHQLIEGSFAGFPAGCPNAHHLVNRTDAHATFIVVGSRRQGETIHFPDDDIAVRR
jgi:uncharacterized cupin superfamily protein